MKKLDSQNQESGKKMMDFRASIVSLIICVILMGILGISYIRTNVEAIFPVENPKVSKQDALKWYNAVAEGNEKQAILCAAKIIPDDSPVLPNPDFIQLCANNGLGTLILTSPFNHFDYLRWKDAFEIQKVLKSFKDNEEPIREIFYQVKKRERILPIKIKVSLEEMFNSKLSNFKENSFVSSIDIWNDDVSSFYEKIRLFSEMTYQLGYQVQIISFYDDSWKLIYVVCEIRKKDVSYLADFVSGNIWKDITVTHLQKNPEPVKKIWPEIVLNSLKRKVYRLPAEAMDYRLYNMQLFAKLHELGVKDLPRFGENPQKRIDQYIVKYSNKSQKIPYSYWNFTFESLKSSPNFPKYWSLPLKRESERKK